LLAVFAGITEIRTAICRRAAIGVAVF